MADDPTHPEKKAFTPGAWQEARALIYAHRRRLAAGLGLMLVNRLAGLVLPSSSKWVIDRVINQHHAELLLPLAIAAGAATLVQAVTGFGLSQVLGVAAQRAITDMRRTVQAFVLRLPVSYFDSTKSGILISRIMTDAEGIRNLVGTGLVQLLGGLLTAAIALAVLFYLNWRLTAIAILILACFGGGMALAFTKLRPLFRERGKLNAEVTGRLGETLGGIRIVKAYRAERGERLVFTRGAHTLFRNIATTMTGISAVGAFATVIIGAIGILMILEGGHAILSGAMTLGDFFMYGIFIGLVAMPLINIAAIGTQITEAFAGLDRIREIRRLATEDAEDGTRAPLADVTGDVGFEDVSFAYVPGKDVLRHVSFHAPPGSTTALVGSSGAGKSTLISLVLAFSRPRAGRIVVDRRDLATVRLAEYRRQLGVVLQDNFLFDGTIAENIAFARPHASRPEIEAAGRIAHCDDFVRKFERGYDTVVGERGVKLSGGERQRVSIARAILADPRILILDEATSSLDSESEAAIQDGLRTLRRGRTTFVIAHRLSTIRSADQILVMEGGEIVERGTHTELLARRGRYRQLYDKQYRFEKDLFINPGEDFTPEPEAPVVTAPMTPPDRL
ncbi:MAG: ABC transporter permease [Gemmatimonadetes bacterium 13_1_40CM_4_69_8]|nr:MAG: ABC transporter permease [Gemmatimonadetes bacterium 13_1_40CM_70_15]OLC74383.1 MAG: ABC transporter permease [Gemmatimonadetes bacterium 13_1_40CM_4_69_8]PYP73898.1 MAG: ABC transporter permease [Gemmatimonadota bacterium]